MCRMMRMAALAIVLSSGCGLAFAQAGGGTDAPGSRIPTTTGGVSGPRSHSNPRMNRLAGSIGGGDSYSSAMNPADGSVGMPGTTGMTARQAAGSAGWHRGKPLGR